MNCRLFSILTIIFITVRFAKAQETAQSDSTSKALLDKYYSLNLIVFQSGSSTENIDHIFELFNDDFTYEHQHYGGIYSREDLYNGYRRNQENGRYDGTVIDIEIENIIYGLNAIAVSKRFITEENGKLVRGEAQMALFRFKNGKISRITEFW